MWNVLYKYCVVAAMFTVGLLGTYAENVSSPNGRLTATTSGATLNISYNHKHVLEIADAVAADAQLAFVRQIKDDYQMLTGKRSHCVNEAKEYRCGNMLLRLYDDGIVFRYESSENGVGKQPAYRIQEGTRRWMQQWCDSYEGFFPLDTTYKVTPVPSYSGISKSAEGWNNRWGYPALLEPQNGVFVLITEANIEHG